MVEATNNRGMLETCTKTFHAPLAPLPTRERPLLTSTVGDVNMLLPMPTGSTAPRNALRAAEGDDRISAHQFRNPISQTLVLKQSRKPRVFSEPLVVTRRRRLTFSSMASMIAVSLFVIISTVGRRHDDRDGIMALLGQGTPSVLLNSTGESIAQASYLNTHAYADLPVSHFDKTSELASADYKQLIEF
eukprot:jgi/Bigna1/81529/fgenesh1_pg.81_\